ncbi:MAG: VWA domain-containing protein [Phycisphaerales bacterium]|nr:VWA domain-containing protein [Phycisphaerales bacterium]
MTTPRLHAVSLALLCVTALASAQSVLPPSVSHVIVPQHRVVPLRPGVAQGIVLTQVDSAVAIVGRVAQTTLDLSVYNPSPTPAEAVLLVPVPAGATVKGFAFSAAPGQMVSNPEGVANIMPRDDARRLYDSIVRASRDPGLLEFAGATLIRSSVFPIGAGATQKIRVEWEELLASNDGRLDYILPRSEHLRQEAPWSMRVTVESSGGIAAVYSPSHALIEVHRGPDSTKRQFVLDAQTQRAPGPFMLSVLPAQGLGATATIAGYPDPTEGGGYFMLLGGVAPSSSSGNAIPREVTIVLDRSGSMAGGKLDQAKLAIVQIVESLLPGERFNIIDYSNGVSLFAREPVAADGKAMVEARAYVATLRPSGGTNISDALVEALRQPHTVGTVPIVLFLTDGLPTVGQTSERAIREIAEKGNPHSRRIYAIGVGADVNVPLLDRIADITRAKAAYIVPGEDVEVKVAQVAKQLSGPVLADIELTARDSGGAEDTRRIHDLAPRRIPDVFAGEQLVVFGAYRGEKPALLELKARTPGGSVGATVPFDPAIATTRHAYVARLWATRRIAELVDEVRQLSSDRPTVPVGTTPGLDDPRAKELVDEIVRLSARFGILTEYTAFFANEGTNLGDWGGLARGCRERLEKRAVMTRTGAAALNQGINFNDMKGKAQVAYDNRFIDESLQAQTISTVQQVSDRCFYNNSGRWVDSQLVASGREAVPTESITIDETVEFGSERHLALIAELAAEGRQGVLSLPGDTIVRHQTRNILVRNPQTPTL